MSDFDALAKGMAIFNDGMQKFATARAINQAQDQVSQLSSMEMDEMKKRQQMAAVAQTLTLNLTKAGANAAAVQQASGALMPAPIKDANDAFIQGQLTGSQPLQQLGQTAQAFETAPQVNENAKNRAHQSREKALDREFMLQSAGIKANKKPATKALSDKQVDFISTLDDDLAIGSQLTQELDASPWLTGPAAGRIKGRGIVDPKFASFQQATQSWFDGYRKNITGAGASEQELERLEQNRPTVKDSPSQFKAKAKRIIEIGQGVRTRKLQNLERAGRDVSGFNLESSVEGQSQAPAAAASSSSPQKLDISNWIKK